MVVLGLQEKEMDYKFPTFSHAVITQMVKQGLVQMVVTSNHDNLHQKSGIPEDKIVDLFGNVYVEKCSKCGTLHKRKVIVPNLGRNCDDPACKGRLTKTGTRMNSATPQEPLEKSIEYSKMADLALVFGSSMSISPFCELPIMAKKKIICTLQTTPYDKIATLKIHAKCDDIMKELVLKLDIKVEPLHYIQDFVIKYEKLENQTKYKINIDNARFNEPCCFILQVLMKYNNKEVEIDQKSDQNFESIVSNAEEGLDTIFVITFKAEYKVDPLVETIKLDKKGQKQFGFIKVIDY